MILKQLVMTYLSLRCVTKYFTLEESQEHSKWQNIYKNNGSLSITYSLWHRQAGEHYRHCLPPDIIGDWNAKVGSQDIPGVTGNFGLGVRNEAGQRLTEFSKRTRWS